MNLHFHSDQREKTNKWVGNRPMLMFHVDVNMQWLGMIQGQLSLLRDNNFIHGALSDLNFAGCFHSLRAVTLHES